MNDRLGPVGRMWNLYKKGGLTPAVASLFGSRNAQQMAFIRSAMKLQRQISALDLPLDELKAVVFDLETTGFHPYNGDEIIAFGAVAVEGRQLKEERVFYSLVNPHRPIPPEIGKLTGIDDSSVREAPPLIVVLRQFFEFVQRDVLIAHGTGHDKSFLNAALWKTSKTRLTHRVLDTMMVAKWLHPDLSTHELDRLLEIYGIPVARRHHALEDSVMTARLWIKMIDRIAEKRVITLGDLYMYLSKR